MHIVQHPRNRKMYRKMNLPSERMVVNGVGLGAVDGFNIGKMFSRMVHITPRSFQPKNIFGAMASATSFVVTAGMSSVLAPKLFSAHSKTMQTAGTIMAAVGAAAGTVALLPAGSITGAGKLLSNFGGSILKGGMSLFGGGGGAGIAPQQQQQGPSYPAGYDPTTGLSLAPMGAQPSYIADPTAVQNTLTPTVFPTMADPNAQYTSQPVDPSSQLTSPSSPYIDTSVPIQEAGMLPNLSTTTWLVLGGLTAAGLYMQYGRKE